MRFGEFVRERRTTLGFKLREFCLTFGYDPSNWSKMERGELGAADELQTLQMWAEQLNIRQGSEEWQKFYDLAFLSRGEVPPDIFTNDATADVLPLVYKILRGRDDAEGEMEKLVLMLRKSPGEEENLID